MSIQDTTHQNEPERYRFGDFELDVPDRQLWKGEERLDLNARYLDALILLVREPDRLIGKERFFEEVWDDVVVSDSALSQCIKEIRKQLGDDAARPRFIQTVPRHGYRFVGTVERSHARTMADQGPTPARLPTSGQPASRSPFSSARRLWLSGSLGGAAAGMFGGMLYGYSLSSPEAGIGTLSTLLVLVGVNVSMGLVGAAGVSSGWALALWKTPAGAPSSALLQVTGASLGGLIVGSSVKMLGLDAFNLFFGTAPSGITGGWEGAALGAAVASGFLLGRRWTFIGLPWRAVAGAGLVSAVTGALIPLAGGHLMGGSLRLLADSFQQSRLPSDSFLALYGDLQSGGAAESMLSGLEGLIFGACVAGAITWALRRVDVASAQ